MGGGGKKGGGKVEVNEYLMSQHVGICTSVDALTSIYVGGKRAWSGVVTEPGNLSINQPNLFGGAKKEGGVGGIVTFLPGRSDQVLPDLLARKLGRTSGADCPGFRGITSLFFHSSTGQAHGLLQTLISLKLTGSNLISSAGFHWVTNNPYLKDLWVGARRAPKGLNTYTAMIPRMGSSGLVPFTSGQAVSLTWWQSCLAEGSGDRARMGIEYYGVDGEPLDDIEWAEMQSTTAMTWTQRTLSGTLPVGAYKIRIYMELERVSGNYNDAYIDDIALTVGGNPVPLVNPGSEMQKYGWTEQLGYLSFRNNLPNPHTGTAYFTGGTAPKTRAFLELTEAATGLDANPAHIIYECLTNRDWGMGASSSIINVASFETAANTLLFERFGLSMLWTRQTTIEAFISEILDHVQGLLYVDPSDGLLTLKLIRDDYVLSELRTINPDNAKMKMFQRKAWGEITSEIVVTWTNPENEQEETVTLHNNAAIAAQGGPVSDSRNYYGVRSADLAMKLAARDLRVSSTPLATCDVELDRTAWNLVPGNVVKIYWPELGLDDVPMRVGPVDYGKPSDPTITASLMEDVFSYATTDYSVSPSSAWEDESSAVPAPMAHSKIVTIPSFFAQNYVPTTGVQPEYPEVVAGVLASSPTAIAYDIYGNRVAVDGTITQASLSTNTVAGWGTTTVTLAAEAVSTFVGFHDLMGDVEPAQNVFVFIGGDGVSEPASEVALISAVDTSSYTLRRGVLDTVPKAWAEGTPCYFVSLNSSLSDLLARSDAETVTYKLLSRTVGGALDVVDAPDLTATLTGRPHYPLRPANVKVNNIGFGPVLINGLDPIPVTWANRNRTMENAQVVYWDDATVTGEVGQTTTIRLYTAGGTLITSYTGLTGTSHNVPASALGANTIVKFNVSSVRDGFESLQAHEITGYVNAGDIPAGSTGTGGGSGTFPHSVSWSSFGPVSTTGYELVAAATSLSADTGDALKATASLSYTNSQGAVQRALKAKWQYRVVGSATWLDMDVPVEGTKAFTTSYNGGAAVIPITGTITVTQSVPALPQNDYEVRLVGLLTVGGATLTISGSASAKTE